jgi:hypothetical protein
MIALSRTAASIARALHKNELVFAPTYGFFGEAKIEDLARRHVFANPQALLGKINRTAHPGFVQIAESPKPAYMTIINLSGQRRILDTEIL